MCAAMQSPNPYSRSAATISPSAKNAHLHFNIVLIVYTNKKKSDISDAQLYYNISMF